MATKGTGLRDAPNKEIYRRRELHKLMTWKEMQKEFKIKRIKREK